MCFQLVGVRGTQRMKLPAVSRLNLESNQSRGNAELQVEQVQVQCASSVASKRQYLFFASRRAIYSTGKERD